MQTNMPNLNKRSFPADEAEYAAAPERESEDREHLEIDLVALFYRLVEKAKYVAAAAIAGALIAGVITMYFTTPQYTATSKLYPQQGDL